MVLTKKKFSVIHEWLRTWKVAHGVQCFTHCFWNDTLFTWGLGSDWGFTQWRKLTSVGCWEMCPNLGGNRYMDHFLGGHLTIILLYSFIVLIVKISILWLFCPIIQIDIVVNPCVFMHIQYSPNNFLLDQHLNSTSKNMCCFCQNVKSPHLLMSMCQITC